MGRTGSWGTKDLLTEFLKHIFLEPAYFALELYLFFPKFRNDLRLLDSDCEVLYNPNSASC